MVSFGQERVELAGEVLERRDSAVGPLDVVAVMVRFVRDCLT